MEKTKKKLEAWLWPGAVEIHFCTEEPMITIYGFLSERDMNQCKARNHDRKFLHRKAEWFGFGPASAVLETSKKNYAAAGEAVIMNEEMCRKDIESLCKILKQL